MFKFKSFIDESKIDWKTLSRNLNAIPILKNNIDWDELAFSPNICMKQRISIFKEELIQAAMHPRRVAYWLDNGLNIEDL